MIHFGEPAQVRCRIASTAAGSSVFGDPAPVLGEALLKAQGR